MGAAPALMAAGLLAAPLAARADVSKDDLVVHFYDVGQGSCVLIECPDGPPILNDCGKMGGGGHAEVSAQRINARLAELSAVYPTPLQVVISHPHTDHFSVLSATGSGIDPDYIRSVYYGGRFQDFTPTGKAWVEALAQRIDGHAHHGLCETNARVSCLGPNEHALATPRLACGKAVVDLLVANAYSYNRSPGVSKKAAQGTPVNGESAILRIRYANSNIVLPGDAEEVSQLYAIENAQALGAPIGRASVLLLPHHGSSEYGSNDAVWAAATLPRMVVVSANIGGNYGHPNCLALDRFDGQTGADKEMARTQSAYSVRCGLNKTDVHEQRTLSHQFIFTETEGEVVLRIAPDGTLVVTCERGSAACKDTP